MSKGMSQGMSKVMSQEMSKAVLINESAHHSMSNAVMELSRRVQKDPDLSIPHSHMMP